MGFDNLIKRIALPKLIACLVMIFTMASFSAAEPLACGSVITSDTQLDSDISCNGTAIIINASNMVLDCAGHTIGFAATSQGFGVSMASVSGVTVKNCNLVQEAGAAPNSAAIRLFSSSNNQIVDNTITLAPPTSYGVALTANSNSNAVSGNTITTSGSNAAGIVVYSSSKNSISNNRVSTAGSIAHALICMAGSSNTISGNKISTGGDGAAGASLALNSNSNSFTDNMVSSAYAGVSIQSSLSNTLSNNLFNATNPVVLTSVKGQNFFNSPSKAAGTNIVGGPSLGGNFWANPSGTGFSETCADADRDAICDSPLVFDSNNLDSLPLAIAVADGDGDGLVDESDNCPLVSNADQADVDSDGIGDACDADNDNDSVLNVNDNCQLVANPDQADLDNDGIGDVCDSDVDGDTVLSDVDACPSVSGKPEYQGCPIVDLDSDGVADDVDVCQSVAGKPEYQGCPVAILSHVDLYTIDKTKRVDCKEAKRLECKHNDKRGDCKDTKYDDCKDYTSKAPVAGALVKVFEVKKLNFKAIRDRWINHKNDEEDNPDSSDSEVYSSRLGLVGTCTTDSLGDCRIGLSSSGRYIAIVKYTDADTGKVVYTGALISPSEFVNTNEAYLASETYLVTKTINKNGKVTFKRVYKGERSDWFAVDDDEKKCQGSSKNKK